MKPARAWLIAFWLGFVLGHSGWMPSGWADPGQADPVWWSFRPLRQPEPPAVRNQGEVRTPIDRFILAALEAQNLSLNPPAANRILARRVHFDLLGLPPAPSELEAFLRDRSPGAWSFHVRRLLDDPRHGERWARFWLDTARFAESHGFEHDYDRPHAYHYRDFVIKALNQDLPYDQFVRWQLAGDEYEPDEPLALMATGFLGAGVFPTQITANEVERTRYDAMDDMLATTGSAMLGLTLGCARCHDHKYDPISMREYYRLLSTFTTTVRSDVELDLNPEDNRRARQSFEVEHAQLVEARNRYERETLPALFEAWLHSEPGPVLTSTWETMRPERLHSEAGASFRDLGDGSFLAEGINGDQDIYTWSGRTLFPRVTAVRLEALAHPSLVKGGPGRADNGNIGLSRIRLWAGATPGVAQRELSLVRPRATFQQNEGHLSIASALDEDPGSGWAVDPQFGRNHAAVFELDPPLEGAAGLELTVQLEFKLNTRHNMGRPRLSVSGAPHPPLEGEPIPAGVPMTLDKWRRRLANQPVQAVLTREEAALLMDWWKRRDPAWSGLQAAVEEHAAQVPQPDLTKVMICAEGYKPMRHHTQGADFFDQTHFLNRGSTDMKGEAVSQGFLEVLMRRPEGEGAWAWTPPDGARHSGRRRALAEWMTDVEGGAGGLLARVMVNRLWLHHFGRGLVETPNDFGRQGSPPSHPELLEWLAAELVRHGWRLKPIHELILNSAVYRQDGRLDQTKLGLDPDNRLWSRRVPRRLEAEAIRDSLLCVAGALDTTQFGPGTLDESSRRRSIYFTIKRSRLNAMMQAFDAPEPLVSQGSRPTTTVAPQALHLLNNPQVRAWAAAWAERLEESGGGSPVQTVTLAYRQALARDPYPGDLERGLAFLEQQRLRYEKDGVALPGRQALIDYAHALFCLNEFVYVE